MSDFIFSNSIKIFRVYKFILVYSQFFFYEGNSTEYEHHVFSMRIFAEQSHLRPTVHDEKFSSILLRLSEKDCNNSETSDRVNF